MTEARLKSLAAVGRWTLLLLLAGLLIGRRDFAHLNLGDLFQRVHLAPPGWSTRAFVTESTMLALLPIALILASHQLARAEGPNLRARFLSVFGWGGTLALAFCAYGVAHAVVAKFSGGDNYLIVRQSALAAYALIFVYAQIFFSGEESNSRVAAWAGVGISLLCALLDTFGWLGPVFLQESQEWMPIYGQQTLPLAILALGLAVVVRAPWYARGLAFCGMAFAAWRQGARPMQSVVPLGMASALILFVVLSIVVAWRGQRTTLLRALACLALFGVLGVSAMAYKARSRAVEQPGTDTSGEVRSWQTAEYARLFELYEKAQMPADLSQRMLSWRPPYVRVDDPEVYKLNAVFLATTSVSVRNNIWRLLVWRRMSTDWRTGHWLTGSGVGKAWFYTAMYSSGFHYGNDREGLDPHNSYLNTLYRYGLIGLLLLLAIVALSIRSAIRSLRTRCDAILEGLCLYSGYTWVFVFFTVGLEGPAYAIPFWFALGLMDARARLSIRQ